MSRTQDLDGLETLRVAAGAAWQARGMMTTRSWLSFAGTMLVSHLPEAGQTAVARLRVAGFVLLGRSVVYRMAVRDTDPLRPLTGHLLMSHCVILHDCREHGGE